MVDVLTDEIEVRKILIETKYKEGEGGGPSLLAK